jgi:hypothetical protein
MLSVFKPWKIRRIARRLAEQIGCEAWKSVPQLFKESEKAAEVLRETTDGSLVWDAVVVMMAFGIHVVDHYTRDFLDEKDRTLLVRKALSVLVWETAKINAKRQSVEGEKITAEGLRSEQENLAIRMQEINEKFVQCSVMHLGGPEYRDEPTMVSLNMCGLMLTCIFVLDSELPLTKMETWEEMDPKLLSLYDTGRNKAWEMHEEVKGNLYRFIEAEGFKQIRDLGVSL